MIPLTDLKATVQRALRLVTAMKDVREAEVYASATGHHICRLNYTSEIPCHGVEEPKSSESSGIGIRAVFTSPDGPRIGFGSEARDFSLKGVRHAIEKARHAAAPDPDFVSLPAPALQPSPSERKGRPLTKYHDRAIMDLQDGALVEAGWCVVQDALKAFSGSEPLAKQAGSKEKLASMGLILSGDVSLVQQRIAIASTHMPKVQTDESTSVTSFVTGMVERYHAKGSGYAAATHLAKFKGEAGGEAARNAVSAVGGQRLPTGAYNVVLGPQPVSDLMTNLILPSLTAEAFYSCRSSFLGEVGRPVASDLTIYDQGNLRGFVGSRGMTCEGLPTGRTDLIRRGVLQGLLSNHYQTQLLLRDPEARDKLGLNPKDHLEVLTPRNGFRLSNRGGRQYDALPTIAATNVFLEASVPHTTATLLSLVNHGVYVGRIWYTYPMNGLRAGDFTCTVVGDSYLIRDGRLAAPLQSNTIRITGNIRQVLQNILGMTKQTRPIIGWGADEVVYAPEIAVRGLHLTEIAQFMDSV